MKNCKEISWLVTQSLDRGLSLSERIAVWTHLMICRNCARFKRQMLLIRSWLQMDDEAAQAGLTQAARQRIADRLRERDSETSA
jgi:hypothetical protein